MSRVQVIEVDGKPAAYVVPADIWQRVRGWVRWRGVSETLCVRRLMMVDSAHRPLRLTLDTNVVVAGLSWYGPPRRLIELVIDGVAVELFSGRVLLVEQLAGQQTSAAEVNPRRGATARAPGRKRLRGQRRKGDPLLGLRPALTPWREVWVGVGLAEARAAGVCR